MIDKKKYRKQVIMYMCTDIMGIHLPHTPSYIPLGMQVNGSYLQSFSNLLANVDAENLGHYFTFALTFGGYN